MQQTRHYHDALHGRLPQDSSRFVVCCNSWALPTGRPHLSKREAAAVPGLCELTQMDLLRPYQRCSMTIQAAGQCCNLGLKPGCAVVAKPLGALWAD